MKIIVSSAYMAKRLGQIATKINYDEYYTVLIVRKKLSISGLDFEIDVETKLDAELSVSGKTLKGLLAICRVISDQPIVIYNEDSSLYISDVAC